MNCDCYSYDSPIANSTLASNPNMTGCSSMEQIKCLSEWTGHFFNSKAIEKCNNQCPFECTFATYSYSQSLAKYPSRWLQNEIADNYANVDAADILMVNIFFGEMFYTLINETPAMTIDQMLGTIGGNLGLFLGMSFLTLLEIVEVSYYTIYYFFIRNSKNASLKKNNFPFKSTDYN